MLKIRLARVGKKKKPSYRLIVSESSRDTYGKALEFLGTYNPFTKVCEVKKERVLYWVSKGAQLTPTTHNLMVDQNVISGSKVKASKSGKKKGAEAAPTSAPQAPVTEEKKEEPKSKEVKEVEEATKTGENKESA